MKKDINTLKKHLSDLRMAKHKILEQELSSSMNFLEKVGELLQKKDNTEYEQEAQRIQKFYDQTSDITKKLSANLDKWITELEEEIKSLE